MKWQRVPVLSAPKERPYEYRYGRWTVRAHISPFGWSRSNYFRWEITLDGNIYWNPKGQRRTTNLLSEAKSIVEELQQKWKEDGFLMVSTRGSLSGNGHIKRIPFRERI